MSAMNELSQTVEELRTAAQALISAADSLTRLFNSVEPADPAEPVKPERKPLLASQNQHELSALYCRQYVRNRHHGHDQNGTWMGHAAGKL